MHNTGEASTALVVLATADRNRQVPWTPPCCVNMQRHMVTYGWLTETTVAREFASHACSQGERLLAQGYSLAFTFSH
jgi:hypothetical protein